MKKAGIYTRVSTGKQKEKYSLPAQEAMLRDYAKQHDLDVVEHYQDAGISAKDTNRPALQRLMRDCEDGRLDVVLAVELDRTTRNVEDMLALSRFFRQHGIEYIEITDPDTGIDTPDGFLRRTVKSTISQYERMHIGERVRRAKQHRAKQGKLTGQPPYGFTSRGRKFTDLRNAGLSEGEATQAAAAFCPEKGRLYLEPKEATIVRLIFDMYRTMNSLRKTATMLNEHGYRTRNGGLWYVESVKHVLTNPVHVGLMRYNTRKADNTKLPADD